jgi:syntaxin-binding protein 1
VLDQFTTKFMTKICVDFNEMFKYKVYQIESLTKARKRYPMTDVIYFVEPIQESITAILDDFPEDDPVDYDYYGQVHLAFTSHVPEVFLEKLANAGKFTKRVISFQEVNTEFMPYVDNVFLVDPHPKLSA